MKRLVVLSALFTALLALIGVVAAAFGPATFLYPPSEAGRITGTDSLWTHGAIGVAFWVFAAVVCVGAIGFVIGVTVRAAGGGLGIVWLSYLLLVAAAAVTLPGNSTFVVPEFAAAHIPDAVGIGIYLVPAVLVGVIDALIATISQPVPDSAGWGSGKA